MHSGGTVTSSLLSLTPDQVAWVQAQAGNILVSLDKILNSNSAHLHPGVQMRTIAFSPGGNLAMDQHPFQVGVEILPVTSRYWDKFWTDGPLG